MALFPDLGADGASIDAEQALRVPLGAVSPLWFAYAGVASAGVAYWWMTRWTKPQNLEAFGKWFDAAPQLSEVLPEPVTFAAIEIEAEDIAEPALAAVEHFETAAETVIETTAALAEPVEAAVEDVVAESVEVAVAAIDDLTRIVGIGPKLSERLADLGVKSFADLAAWTGDDLEKFDKALDLKGRAVRDAWIAQARRFADASIPA